MASVYKEGRERHAVPSSREEFYCDKCAALFYGPPLPPDFRPPLRIGGEQARAAEM